MKLVKIMMLWSYKKILLARQRSFTSKQNHNYVNQVQDEIYFLCASHMQTTQRCPSSQACSKYYVEQLNALNNFLKSFASPLLEIFNPNWWNYHNFSSRYRISLQLIQLDQMEMQDERLFPPPNQIYPAIPFSTLGFVAPP